MSSSTDGDATTPNHHLEKASTQVWPDNPLSSFRILPQQAKIHVIPYLLVAPRCSSSQYPPAPWCQFQSVQAPSVNFKRRHIPLLKLRLRFLVFFKVALFANINNMAYREILIKGVQQLEDIFSIGRTNLCVSLDTLGLGANGVSGERRNWRKQVSSNFLKI